MHEEDILLRSTQGIAYIFIAPCIILSASVWFTSDSIGIVVASLFQIYIFILFFLLSGYIRSLRSYYEGNYKDELSSISLIPIFLASTSGLLTILLNPVWGIGFLLIGSYLTRFIKTLYTIFNIFPKKYLDLFNRISIILCICLMLIFTYWVNPYSNPIRAYI